MMSAALVGLHMKRLASARALASEAICALAETVETIRKAGMEADFTFAMPWLELTQLMEAAEDVGRIDYLAALALRSEVIAKHTDLCASVRKQLSDELENRRLLVGKLDSELWNAKRIAQTRVAKANEALAGTKHHALTVTVPSAKAIDDDFEVLGDWRIASVAGFLVMAMATNGDSGAKVRAAMFFGVAGAVMLFPVLLNFFSKLRRVSKAEIQARENIAAAQASCVKETADAEVELASASHSLGASRDAAQKRFASAQSAGNDLVECFQKNCPSLESNTPPLCPKHHPEADTTFVVSLTSAGNNIIAVIKSLRELVPGLGLAEARAFAEDTPSIVAQGLTRPEAETFQKRLETVGAKVVIVPRSFLHAVRK